MSDPVPLRHPGECWWFDGLQPSTAHPVATLLPALSQWLRAPGWLELEGPPGSGRRWLAMALLGRLAAEYPGLPMACLDLAVDDLQLHRFALGAQLGLPPGLDPSEAHRRGALAFSLAGAKPGAIDHFQSLLPSDLSGWWIVLACDERLRAVEELALGRGARFSTRRLEASDRHRSRRFSWRPPAADHPAGDLPPDPVPPAAELETAPPVPPLLVPRPPEAHSPELATAVAEAAARLAAGDEEGAWSRFLPLAIPLHSTLQALVSITGPPAGQTPGEIVGLTVASRPFLGRAGLHALARAALAGCVEIARATGDPVAEIECLIELGAALLAGGDPFGARAPLEQAIARARTLSLPEAERAALGGIAERALATGDLATATASLEAALALPGETPSRSRISRRLGDARLRLGERERAAAAYREALESARGAEEGEARLAIAMLALEERRETDALEELERALVCFRGQGGAAGGEARALGARAIALQSLERHREALASLQAARQVHRRLGDAIGEMLDLHHTSESLEAMGEQTPGFAAQVLAARIARTVGGMVATRVVDRLERMRARHGQEAFAPWEQLLEVDPRVVLEEAIGRLV